MGQEGPINADQNVITRNEEARLYARKDNGEYVPITLTSGGKIESAIVADNGARLTDVLETVGDDENRTRIYVEDGAGGITPLSTAQLNQSADASTVVQVQYIARALNSQGLDEFVSRVTDSAGTQIDPLTTAVTASQGGDQVRVDLQNNNIGTLPVEQQTPIGVEDSTGTQIDPLNQSPLSSVGGDELRTDIQASGIQVPTDQQDALEKSNENYGADIENTVTFKLQIDGYTVVDVVFTNADSATDVTVERSWDDNNYFEVDSETGVTDFQPNYAHATAKWVRVEVSGTGTAGDTADVIIGGAP